MSKLPHSCMIFGSISVATGLILMVFGFIYDAQGIKLIGVGIISFGVGCFITTIVYVYGKLDIRYNNWICRARVAPRNSEPGQPKPTNVVLTQPHIESSEMKQKSQVKTPLEPSVYLTGMSDMEIH